MHWCRTAPPAGKMSPASSFDSTWRTDRFVAHEWTASLAAQVAAPSRETLKVQQFDVLKQLNDALVSQQINDAFESILSVAGSAPSRGDRVNSDGELAAIIHDRLTGLTAREACDADMWAWFACCGCPRYVRWRWETDNASPLDALRWEHPTQCSRATLVVG